MEEIEYFWPIPGDETIKIYCWMKMLDKYEEARLSRLGKIARPSQQRQHQRSRQENVRRAIFEEILRRNSGSFNTSTSGTSNTWTFT